MIAELTDAEIVARWPAEPPKPIAAYSDEELRRVAKYGPAVVGGLLYLAARKVQTESAGGRYGPAVLSKSSEPVKHITDTEPEPVIRPSRVRK